MHKHNGSMGKFNAGERLRDVIREVFNDRQEDAGEWFYREGILGKFAQGVISKWCRMEMFSPTIRHKLKNLERKGVNPRYLTDPTVRDWRLSSDPDPSPEKVMDLQREIIELNKKIVKLMEENQSLKEKLMK